MINYFKNDFQYMYYIFNEGTLSIHDTKTMIYFLEDKKYELTSDIINEFQKKNGKTYSNKI